jgi:hypothetical protein
LSWIECPPAMTARGANDLGPAPEDLGERRGRELRREGDEVQGEDRLAPHGVDVAQGVGGGDRAEVVGLVDDRREEVGRQDQRPPAPEVEDGGIVRLGEPDEDVGMPGRVEGVAENAQDLRELPGGQLRRSPRAGAEARELSEDLVGHSDASFLEGEAGFHAVALPPLDGSPEPRPEEAGEGIAEPCQRRTCANA